MPNLAHGLGWIPDLPDHRDHAYAAPLAALGPLPAKVDLTSNCPPVYDQGQLGSCTANAIAGAVQFDQMKQHLTPVFTPSRLFIYYNERQLEGTVESDAGAFIRDGIKSVSHQGACPESEWPYELSRFAQRPPHKAYTDAVKYRAVAYQRINRGLAQMKGCLAEGFPWVLGFTCYESLMTQSTAQMGDIPMPAQTEQVIGGHAILAVGYDDERQRFLIRNSWGSGWGQAGYGTIPYAYLLDENLSDDFWTVRVVQ